MDQGRCSVSCEKLADEMTTCRKAAAPRRKSIRLRQQSTHSTQMDSSAVIGGYLEALASREEPF